MGIKIFYLTIAFLLLLMLFVLIMLGNCSVLISEINISPQTEAESHYQKYGNEIYLINAGDQVISSVKIEYRNSEYEIDDIHPGESKRISVGESLGGDFEIKITATTINGEEHVDHTYFVRPHWECVLGIRIRDNGTISYY